MTKLMLYLRKTNFLSFIKLIDFNLDINRLIQLHGIDRI
jgi:hypothetical protein